MISGFLNVWKPVGISSHDVVARIRRVTRMSRVGHGGTLDPGADGILPIALGLCTRLLPYVNFSPKVYQAEVTAGVGTHTGDAQGRTVARSSAWRWSLADLEQTARWLTGSIWQVPPQVSALKVEGRRHYDTVRHGGVVWPVPRRMEVACIDRLHITPCGWKFCATVSSGTYIRALVRDWAYLLGEVAHMSALTRIAAGPFTDEGAVSLEHLEHDVDWTARLARWHQVLSAVPQWELSQEELSLVQHGDIRGLAGLPHIAGEVMALVRDYHLYGLAEGLPWRYRVVFEGGI